jgi:replicative DNA helicase
MTSYTYERGFRLKIISLLLDSSWIATYGTLVKPEYFEQEDEEKITAAILAYRITYNKLPRDPDDIIVLCGAEYALTVSKIFDIYECGDNALASDKAIQFAKEQAAKIAILESVDDVEKGEFDAPIKRMEEVIKIGQSMISPGIDPIRDVDKWLYSYWNAKVRTGLYHLDTLLDGGLGVPELGLILAPPNRGKSMTLISIGYGAASIGSGKNVVHFTHEMSIEQVAKRYAARIAFKFPSREDNLSIYEDELLEQARKLVPGNIRIIGGAQRMTTSDFEGHMDRLLEEGFKPDLIIDDYPDLIIPPKSYHERRFELSAIYEWLRSMSDKYQCPIWGATQGNRDSLSKEIITMAYIAEDIGKAAIADVIVALCQTYEEEQMDQCRLFIAKLRDGSKKTNLIACKFYSDCQAIITTDFIHMKDEKNA